MATPMTLPDVCAICFEPYGAGTFDVIQHDNWILVNVCPRCRWWETQQLILAKAGQ